MRLAQAMSVGSRFLVDINLLMAAGIIAIFTRMAPAFATSIEHNERPLKACEDLLAVMAVTGIGSPFSIEQARIFQTAFDRTKANITEPQEPEICLELPTKMPLLGQRRITAI